MVAGALLTYPYREEAKNLHGYPIAKENCTTAILQSVMTHPAYAGMGLSAQILSVAEDVAAMSGHVHMMAKISDTNTSSQACFGKSGYQLHTQDYWDEKGQYWAHFVAKTLMGSAPCLKPAALVAA